MRHTPFSCARVLGCTRSIANRGRFIAIAGMIYPPPTQHEVATAILRQMPEHCPPPPPSLVYTAADMEEHPGCRYNMSASKECSSTDGSFTCETIRRVFRDCPGMRPKQVYDITTKDSGTVARSSKSPHGDNGGGDAGGAADERKMPKRDRVSLCCYCR